MKLRKLLLEKFSFYRSSITLEINGYVLVDVGSSVVMLIGLYLRRNLPRAHEASFGEGKVSFTNRGLLALATNLPKRATSTWSNANVAPLS